MAISIIPHYQLWKWPHRLGWKATYEQVGKAGIADVMVNYVESPWSEAAAWVEAIGAIAAVVGTGWVATRDSRAARGREERAEAAAERREARGVLAAKTAALNLAILAATQIHDLHILLVDEAWRGRVTRISASHALLATERMLTAFPIQNLTEASAMVEFSRFPASLATAAEIYANLERAVRAAAAPDRDPFFEASNEQMARLDQTTQRQLSALAKALELDLPALSDVAAAPVLATVKGSGSTGSTPI